MSGKVEKHPNLGIGYIYKFPDEQEADRIISGMDEFGLSFDAPEAMALSVGATCGVATQLLLDRHPAFTKPGIHAPYSRDMCDPIREGVAREGVALVEKVL
ncbi:hypothetical protein NKR19_g1614 [Coniochaeta hoffmannii]|uniref:Saccharopine dehydrogenase-like C-terminal domain-containing protein n=1 Tax=Coniochaeta hoffmannii TaxID=91930 RepID=A0AA38SI47_9PEZI|nr:hypothetical protein NKR19_g1614 [Coniochaeta hoffmannii]